MSRNEDASEGCRGGDKPFPRPSGATQTEIRGERLSIGCQIGPYRLVSILGEGGFGIVYLAEQKEPVQRKVALKVVKPGMDSKQVLARFEAEQQALALLNHPNIAHVFDAGMTPEGYPYFVMECVQGTPITAYCDQEEFTVEDRLRLFMQVCDAVQHAHQKGIIHRDLKPSNILVADLDGRPVPVIIDFGVAKALNQPLTARTLFTEQGQLLGTPEYMSPEQTHLANQDIDTRSDIYSLGVLLYELLTGALPFAQNTLREAAFDNLLKIIREQEPPRPSTRLSGLGEEGNTIAQKRSTNTAALARRLSRELEWIPLKAMRKERDHRYQSARELAEDIANYLGGKPLEAGPESVIYRTRKLLRRHHALVIGATAVLLTLLGGITVYAIGQSRARVREAGLRDRAEQAEHAARKEQRAAEDQRAAAVQAAELARAQERIARNYLYAARIGLVQRVWESGNSREVLNLLNSLRPEPGQEDLRAFDWYYFWRLCCSEEITLHGRGYDYAPVAFSPSGKRLAVGGNSRTIALWDTETRQQMASLQGHGGTVTGLAFLSSDGGTLVSGSVDKTVRFWDVNSGRQTSSLDAVAPIVAIAVSKNCERLAAGLETGGAMLWHLDGSGREPEVIRNGPPSYVATAALSPDGKTLAIAGGDLRAPCKVALWSVDKREVSMELKGHTSTVRSVVFSPDGTRLATASHDETVRLWDVSSGKELAARKGHVAPLWCVAFGPDGRTLATGSSDRTARTWSVPDLAELHRFKGHTKNVMGLSFSPDAGVLASVSSDDTVRLWDLRSPRGFETSLDHTSAVTSVAFSSDGKVVATACQNGETLLWDATAGQQIRSLKGHDQAVWSVAVSRDGKTLATGSVDRTVRLWDMSTGEALATLDGLSAAVNFVIFSPDRVTLAVGCEDMSLTLWDMEMKDKRTIREGQERPSYAQLRPSYSGTFSPDGKILATGGWDSRGHVLDVTTGQERLSLKGHELGVWGMAFSRNGDTLATASEDMTIRLWKRADPEIGIPVVCAHDGPVLCVAFSPDDRVVASGSVDRTVRLWDAGSGAQRLVLEGHHGPVTSVVFSPDGSILASASEDKRVLLWQAATPAEAGSR